MCICLFFYPNRSVGVWCIHICYSNEYRGKKRKKKRNGLCHFELLEYMFCLFIFLPGAGAGSIVLQHLPLSTSALTNCRKTFWPAESARASIRSRATSLGDGCRFRRTVTTAVKVKVDLVKVKEDGNNASAAAGLSAPPRLFSVVAFLTFTSSMASAGPAALRRLWCCSILRVVGIFLLGCF